MVAPSFLALLPFTLFLACSTHQVAAQELTVKKWHLLELTFEGPRHTETDNAPNPFLDYRLRVAFTSPSRKERIVPGFFDGGNAWKVRFTPDEVGRWSYGVAFRRGPRAALSDEADVGEPAAFHGKEGAFTVAARDPDAPGFLKWGRLEYVGGHYLKFRDGPHWMRGGADSPENFLAYHGFANTTAGKFGLHRYAPHVRDWTPGDPDWGNGKGRGIIGALNYLASRHVNSIYFLPMNIGGDGQDVWPFAGKPRRGGHPANDNLHYDVEKLRQWEIVFAHAQRKGIALHVVLNEAETPNKKELDDAELGTERKLFHRELVARFAHHNALQWNLSEEYDLNLNFGPDRMKRFAGHLQSVDPYDHSITVHNQKPPLQSWMPFFGDSRFSITSIQYHPGKLSYGDLVEAFRKRSNELGRPVPVSVDEFDRLGRKDGEHRGKKWPHLSGWSRLRKAVLWPIYLSGGQVEYILETMLNTEDFRLYEAMWDYTWYARKFLEENLPFWEMKPEDALLSGESGKYGGGQVLAKKGRVYAVYLPRAEPGGELEVPAGTYEKRWYNPRTGRFEGASVKVQGGGKVSLGRPPADPGADWALLLRRTN